MTNFDVVYGPIVIVQIVAMMPIALMIGGGIVFVFGKPISDWKLAFQHELPLRAFITIILSTYLYYALLLYMDLTDGNLNGGLDKFISVLYQVLNVFVALFTLISGPILISFNIFHDPKSSGIYRLIKQLGCSFIGSSITIAIFFIFYAIFYSTLGYVDMSVQQLTLEPMSVGLDAMNEATFSCVGCSNESAIHFYMSFTLFVGATMTYFSYFLFVPLVALGLTTFPIHALQDLIYIPTKISLDDFMQLRMYNKKRTEVLLLECDDMMSKQKNGKLSWYSTNYMYFKRKVDMLAYDWDITQQRFIQGGMSCFGTFNLLLIFIISVPLSLLWIAHIFVYNGVNAVHEPIFGMLNTLWYYMDRITSIPALAPKFPLLGAFCHFVFCFYLTICMFSAATKLSKLFPCVFIRPIARRNTSIDDLSFYFGIFALTFPALINFIGLSSFNYLSGSVLSTITYSMVNFRGLGTIPRYISYAILIIMVLGGMLNVMLACCCGQRLRPKTRLDLMPEYKKHLQQNKI